MRKCTVKHPYPGSGFHRRPFHRDGALIASEISLKCCSILCCRQQPTEEQPAPSTSHDDAAVVIQTWWREKQAARLLKVILTYSGFMLHKHMQQPGLYLSRPCIMVSITACKVCKWSIACLGSVDSGPSQNLIELLVSSAAAHIWFPSCL